MAYIILALLCFGFYKVVKWEQSKDSPESSDATKDME